MDLRLEPIDRSNWQACIQLAVADEQKSFVASNLYSIAQSQFHPGLVPRGVFDGGTLVGFVMVGPDRDDVTQRWIWRLMIDARFQGRGHGAAVLARVIEEERALGTPTLYLSTEPENHHAIRLYERFGFRATGAIEDGEAIFALDVPTAPHVQAGRE